MTTSDPLTTELLAAGPFWRDHAAYALIGVTGRDAGDFLQRLCSQDVVGLPAFGVAPAAFLDAKGKLQVTTIVARTADGYLLETQSHQHERLLALLERYHFTEQLQIAARAGTCRERIEAANTAVAGNCVVTDNGVVMIAHARRGVRFTRWHAPVGVPLPALAGRLLSDDLAECLRMAAGVVRVGVDTEPNTLALEADLGDHCSTTKGCYTGQEIVARIHTYGHANRALCLLHLDAGPAITAPQTLHEPEDQLAVGRVMAAVPVPGKPLRIGLGYLPKDFQAVGTRLQLAGGTAATVAGFESPSA